MSPAWQALPVLLRAGKQAVAYYSSNSQQFILQIVDNLKISGALISFLRHPSYFDHSQT
jgi:hypothetical protein